MHTNQSSAPKRFWRFNIFWIGWLAILSYLCDKRPQELPEISLLQFEGADKLVHFIFYFTLTNLLLFGFKMQSAYPVLKKNTYKIVFVFAFVWGGIIELSQKFFFTYRFAEWEDQIANILGVLLAFVFFKTIAEKLIFKYGKQEN